MREPKDNLQPETIDHVIESGEPAQPDRQTARLIQQLQTGSQEYKRANERSLDRIWKRLAQSQEHAVSLPPQWKESEEMKMPIKEGNVMQNNNDTWGTNAPTYISHISLPKKHHSRLHVVGIGLIAAVAIITIVSFTLFSNVLRPAAPTASKGSANITGVSRQQKALNKAKLVCSFGSTNHTPNAYWLPVLSWSSQGQIAVTGNSQLETFSAQNCDTTFTQTSQAVSVRWSPNGKMLMVTNYLAINILDRNGKTIANFPFRQLGIMRAYAVTWSPDSTKLTFLCLELHGSRSIRSIDVRNGNVKILIKSFIRSGLGIFSPNGKLFLQEFSNKTEGNVETWNMDNGKETIFNILFKVTFVQALSPDGSMLATGGPQQVQIYSTANGKLLSTLEDHDTVSKSGIGALAWSPDGKYLAESSSAIHIYDVNTQKILTTFGKVGNHDYIRTLSWAPDGRGLASINVDSQTQNPIRVWALE